jgi:spore maturation protein SpmA/spore maturation protein SpmB
MALSRIWTAFIIAAMTVAAINFFFVPNTSSKLLTLMVSGKSGDTMTARKVDSATLPAIVHETLKTEKTAVWGKQKVTREKNGDFKAFTSLPTNGIFETCKTAVVDLCIGLIGIMALFMGFMNIAEKAGGINFLSRIIGPFFGKIFPEVPKGHPAMGHMMMNFSANLLGLDNAATPFGIKAMQSLQELNPTKDRASNAQIMFLCLHASGLTLIPTFIIADRAISRFGVKDPTDIFIPCMIATFAATMAVLIIVSIKQGINLFRWVIIAWVMGIVAVILALIMYVNSLAQAHVELFSGNLGSGILLLVLLCIVLGGLYKKINIFDAFIEGAKGGFETAIKLIPYLVGLLVAISLLRNSGAFDIVMDGFRSIFVALGGDTRIVDGLPTALMKPFSGSGAKAMMFDTMEAYPGKGDSFAATLASVFRGSADTTFYIVAVYMGAVGIKNPRYSIGAMLLADLVGIITAIFVCYLFFAGRA